MHSSRKVLDRYVFRNCVSVSVCRVHADSSRINDHGIKLIYQRGGPKKRGHRLMTIILSNLNRLKILTVRFHGKFADKRILKLPSYLACVAKHKNIHVSKKIINDKLQGSIATYLKCGGIVNNQRKKGLLLSLSEKKNF